MFCNALLYIVMIKELSNYFELIIYKGNKCHKLVIHDKLVFISENVFKERFCNAYVYNLKDKVI